MVTPTKTSQSFGKVVHAPETGAEELAGPAELGPLQKTARTNVLEVSQPNAEGIGLRPSELAVKGAGIVTSMGPGAQKVTVGSHVAYALGPVGGYAGDRPIPAERHAALSDGSSADDMTLLFQGHHTLH